MTNKPKPTLETLYLKLGEIKPYERNVRDNNEEAVKQAVESLKRYGYQERILVDENNVIIRGHTRHKAFQKMGVDGVEVLRVKGLPADKVKELRIIDNRTAEYSLWDTKKLDLELREFIDQEYAKSFGLNDTMKFGKEYDVTAEELKQAEENLTASFTEREEAKKDGMIGIPCPHCSKVYMMRFSDLANKVKYKMEAMSYGS